IWPYKPDVVVVSVNATDIFEYVYRGTTTRMQDFTALYRKAPWWEPLYAHCYLVRLFMHKILKYNRFLFTESEWEKQKTEAIESLKSSLEGISTACDVNNARCIFLFNPLKYEMQVHRLDCQPVLDYARQQKMEVIDLMAFFDSKGVKGNNLDEY